MTDWHSYQLARGYETFVETMERADPSVSNWIYQQLGTLGERHGRRHGLDLGCGTGRWTRTMLDTVCSTVTGIDSSPIMLTLASTQTQSVYATYRERRLLDVAETADAVLCLYTAHHAGRTHEVLSHIRSLVRPGGVAVVVDVVNTGGWSDVSYHTKRAARLAAMVATRLGQPTGEAVQAFLTSAEWMRMVGASQPPSLVELRNAVKLALPGAVIDTLGPETVGVAWRAGVSSGDVSGALEAHRQASA